MYLYVLRLTAPQVNNMVIGVYSTEDKAKESAQLESHSPLEWIGYDGTWKARTPTLIWTIQDFTLDQ